jgi:hypothetical protein
MGKLKQKTKAKVIKVILIVTSLVLALGIGGVSGADSIKVFNPMLPCNIKQHGQSSLLPLSVFGDETGYINMAQSSAHNTKQYRLYLNQFGVDKRNDRECQTYEYNLFQGENQTITAVNHNGGKLISELGLIVTTDNTRYIGNDLFRAVSFFDHNTGELIGKQIVKNISIFGIEVISKRLFTTDGSNIWDIYSGWVDCVSDGIYGFSPLTYYRSGNIYSRIDDSFVFRYEQPELKDFTFLGIKDEDYVFRSHDVSTGERFRIDEIIKHNFKGEIVKHWKTDFLEPGMDSTHCFYIHDNFAMFYCDSSDYPRNYRLYDLDSGKVLWNLPLYPEMMGKFVFDKGTFYAQGPEMAIRVKPDGSKIFVHFSGSPKYISFGGNPYYVKGIPSSDPDNLQCGFARLEQDRQVDTDLMIAAYPNYSTNEKTVVGWKKLDLASKDRKKYQPYEYCIQKLTGSGFLPPIKKTVDFPDKTEVSLDFENLVAAQLISPEKVKIINLEDTSEKELNIFRPGDTYINHRTRSIQIKGSLLALYKTYYENNDAIDYVDIYDLAKSEWVLHDKNPKTGHYTRLRLSLGGNRQSKNLCFAGNALIAWREDSTYIEIVNLADMQPIKTDSVSGITYINDRLYFQSGSKFMILNPVTFEEVSFDCNPCNYGEPLFNLWLEEYGSDQVFGNGLLPQRYMPMAYLLRFGNWFSKYPSQNISGDFIQLKTCPAYAIKRISDQEFVITNTSPDCTTPLNAKVYLIAWPNDWCPAFWQARNIAGQRKDLKLGDSFTFKVPEIELLQSKRFALIIQSNGLLDTQNSELSDFDKEGRPLFDGIPISYDEQKSVVVTVWER